MNSIVGDSNNIEIYSINDKTKSLNVHPNFNIFFRKKIPVNYVVFLIIFRVLSCGVKVIMTDVSSSYIKLIEETQISIFI